MSHVFPSPVLPGSDTVLVMTSSNQTCSLLREYLDVLDLDAPRGEQGRGMMLERLRGYVGWKAHLHASVQTQVNPSVGGNNTGAVQTTGSAAAPGEGELNEAMKKKDRDRRERAASRRRVRGGAPGGAATSQRRPLETDQEGMMKSEGLMMDDVERVAYL